VAYFSSKLGHAVSTRQNCRVGARGSSQSREAVRVRHAAPPVRHADLPRLEKVAYRSPRFPPGREAGLPGGWRNTNGRQAAISCRVPSSATGLHARLVDNKVCYSITRHLARRRRIEAVQEAFHVAYSQTPWDPRSTTRRAARTRAARQDPGRYFRPMAAWIDFHQNKEESHAAEVARLIAISAAARASRPGRRPGIPFSSPPTPKTPASRAASRTARASASLGRARPGWRRRRRGRWR
jgi:hypothetical protein